MCQAVLNRKHVSRSTAAEKLIKESCVILGYHSHMVPLHRTKHVSRVEPKEPKLLVFVKVCVSEPFSVIVPDIAQNVWVSTLEDAKCHMSEMRDETKYFAEIDAITSAALR